MIYTSELIQKIVKAETAEKALNYISPIYADAEYFLRILNAICTQLDVVWGFGQDMWDEIVPQTADKLLPYWEQEYGIDTDTSKTLDERRNALLNKIRVRPPMNPTRMVNRLGLVINEHARVEENTGANQFTLWLTGGDYDMRVVRRVVDEAKPAHLNYIVKHEEFTKSALYFGMVESVGKIITLWQVN